MATDDTNAMLLMQSMLSDAGKQHECLTKHQQDAVLMWLPQQAHRYSAD
jgi:hypothetical protein